MRHAASSSSELLKVIEQSGAAAVHWLTPVEAGRSTAIAASSLSRAHLDVGSIRDLQAEGPGGPIALRMYHSLNHASNEPLPVLVYCHGGGFVIGDLDTHDVLCRELANASGCAVVAVDYRLALEHPFPAPVIDCLAATKWGHCQASAFRLDASRMAVGGDGAGGNSRPLSASWRAAKVARRSAFSC